MLAVPAEKANCVVAHYSVPQVPKRGDGEDRLRKTLLRDPLIPTSHLAAPAALALFDEWGVTAVQHYNHTLAWNGARVLADRWGTVFDTPEELVGRQVLAVVNFPPRQIGPMMSEVLVLGVPDAEGEVILIGPGHEVPLGGKIF